MHTVKFLYKRTFFWTEPLAYSYANFGFQPRAPRQFLFYPFWFESLGFLRIATLNETLIRFLNPDKAQGKARTSPEQGQKKPKTIPRQKPKKGRKSDKKEKAEQTFKKEVLKKKNKPSKKRFLSEVSKKNKPSKKVFARAFKEEQTFQKEVFAKEKL